MATDVREAIEWIGIRWHDEEESAGLARVLLVGDSIVAGHGTLLRDKLKGKYGVDYFATSKIVSDHEYMEDLRFMMSRKKYDLIIFNNGLHGEKVDDEVYAEALREVLEELKSAAPHLVWRTSTPCYPKPSGAENRWIERVPVRNALAAKVAGDLGLETLDLYGLLEGKPELVTDGVHFSPEGYAMIVETTAKFVEGKLG